MADIISLGELLIDLTQTDVTAEGVRCLSAFPGGAPATVAVAAARLGAGSAFIDDERGMCVFVAHHIIRQAAERGKW